MATLVLSKEKVEQERKMKWKAAARKQEQRKVCVWTTSAAEYMK